MHTKDNQCPGETPSVAERKIQNLRNDAQKPQLRKWNIKMCLLTGGNNTKL